MTHTMVWKATSENGKVERWECPICGQVLLIKWNPWQKLRIVDGDLNEAHTCGKGGIVMGEVEIMEKE